MINLIADRGLALTPRDILFCMRLAAILYGIGAVGELSQPVGVDGWILLVSLALFPVFWFPVFCLLAWAGHKFGNMLDKRAPP